MSALATLFASLRAHGSRGLVTFVTAGDPTAALSTEIVCALDRGGADVIEVGVPFSDPIADGPAIQQSSERALRAGGTMSSTLNLIAAVRGRVRAPIVLFTYVNPVLRMGVDQFIDRAAAAGVNGVLLLDLPIEESADMHAALDSRGLDQIFLVSPTTTDARLATAARLGRGFLYAISRLGVTGTRATVSESAEPLVTRIRQASALPVALGFGISRPEHVASVCAFADAAVVGSAIVQVITDAVAAGRPPAADVEKFVTWLKHGVGQPHPLTGATAGTQ
ncbi:MAG TPA: tryptophan synthase subunit alpha [Vicinamibacterales bacterium]|nr:tryptophan synthase subunit alpha [Vicinamibacterales bacterium]